MSDPRVIPVLLMKDGGLVKTVQFGKPRYIGDPINTVRIFNEKDVDELIVLDISATANARPPDFQQIRMIASECRMPLAFGGGIRALDQASRLIDSGVEKVTLSSAAIADFGIVTDIANVYGSQSVAVVLDYKRGLFGARGVFTHNGTEKLKVSLIDLARMAIDSGAGELILNSISDDGMMTGYDLDLVRELTTKIETPMTFIGGCGTPEHIKALFRECRYVGAGVGSMFVYKGALKGVLINYLNPEQKEQVIRSWA